MEKGLKRRIDLNVLQKGLMSLAEDLITSWEVDRLKKMGADLQKLAQH